MLLASLMMSISLAYAQIVYLHACELVAAYMQSSMVIQCARGSLQSPPRHHRISAKLAKQFNLQKNAKSNANISAAVIRFTSCSLYKRWSPCLCTSNVNKIPLFSHPLFARLIL